MLLHFNHALVNKGGVVLCEDGSVVNVSSSVFANNTAARGAGMMVQFDSTAYVSGNVTFFGNTGLMYGAAIYVLLGSALVMQSDHKGGVTIAHNYGAESGAVFGYLSSSILCKGNISVESNQCAGYGAGIWASDSCSVHLQFTRLVDNHAGRL